jgi:hypothetical protein
MTSDKSSPEPPDGGDIPTSTPPQDRAVGVAADDRRVESLTGFNDPAKRVTDYEFDANALVAPGSDFEYFDRLRDDALKRIFGKTSGEAAWKPSDFSAFDDGGKPAPNAKVEFTLDRIMLYGTISNLCVAAGLKAGGRRNAFYGVRLCLSDRYVTLTVVLDGGTGSNFLTGGIGDDTFFVDDRGAAAPIWSTVNNFHPGDAATIWGVTPSDFDLSWVNGQGATGYTGLTLHATAAGVPTASLTLAGFTRAALYDGEITVSFGSTAATNGLSGSTYMYVHAN